MRSKVIWAWVLALALTVSAQAEGNISSTDKYAWGSNIGWLNFSPVYGGVTVDSEGLSGYAWGAGVGWVKLAHEGVEPPYANTGADNWGVNKDKTTGKLSGYAWSPAVGWINFNPGQGQQVSIDGQGNFSGYAWSAGAGWIRLASSESTAYKVTVTTHTGEAQ